MARFQKTALRSGVFPQAGNFIRVSDSDKKVAHDSYKKMLSYGYKSPVILEHSAKNDASGFPAKKTEMSAREKLQFQAGWGDDVVINANGDLDVIANVKSKDGLKLVREVGTYLSPQFGPWKVPETGEILPMAITHFAITAAPVDIGQNPEWKELPEDSQVIEASQLSQQVVFSMAGFVPEKKKPAFGGSGGDDSDSGDSDKNNNGVVDGQIPGKPGSATGDSGDTDTDDDGQTDSDSSGGVGGEEDVGGNIPGDNAQIWSQIIAALKLSGVILPDAVSPINNPHALLAGLMTCAHHTQKAQATQATQPDPIQQVQGQMQDGQNGYGQDPRMAGTKQENMFTMSQTTDENGKTVTTKTPISPVVPDLKNNPEFIQMSQTNAALSAKLTELEREKFNSRIDGLIKTGRLTKDKADSMKSTVGTYQFSTVGASTDVVKMEAAIEFAESLPEGAIWSPEERITNMSITEEGTPRFAREDDGRGGLTEAEQEAELTKMYG